MPADHSSVPEPDRTTRARGGSRSRGALLLIAAALLGGATYFALRPAAEGGPRLVLLYVPCTVNRSFLSPYDPRVPYTPHLAAFGRESLVFTMHHTEEGQSGIAFASILSGSQSMRHGVYYHPTPIDDSVYLISEAFRDHGYDTFYWSDHLMASPELNYAQGVKPENVYWTKHKRNQAFSGDFLRAGDPRFERILDRLRADPKYTAFVFTNFSVSHAPYREAPVDEFCGAYPDQCAAVTKDDIAKYTRIFRSGFFFWQYARDLTAEKHGMSPADVAQMARVVEILYKASLFHLDRLFGAVVESIDAHGLRDESLIAFTADHGEVLGRDSAPYHWTHGLALQPDDILVPLLMRGRDVKPGRFDSITRSIDVFPTLAGLSGIALAKNSVMGVDLSSAIRGRSPAPELVAFVHSSLLPMGFNTVLPSIGKPFPRRDPQVVWVGARAGASMFKLTSNDGATFAPHVYDWNVDPEEQHDLYDPHDERQAAMVRRLAEYKESLVEGYGYWRALAEGHVPTERQKEMLRNLGYIQ
jgi:arylsulfatase A-like enzyme